MLKDVADGKITMEEFVAQFSDEDLSCIVRGEGMGSPKVTPGTAAAYGGVSEHLKKWEFLAAAVLTAHRECALTAERKRSVCQMEH